MQKLKLVRMELLCWIPQFNCRHDSRQEQSYLKGTWERVFSGAVDYSVWEFVIVWGWSACFAYFALLVCIKWEFLPSWETEKNRKFQHFEPGHSALYNIDFISIEAMVASIQQSTKEVALEN